MLAQTAHAEGDDGREDYRLEKQRDEQQGDAGVTAVRDGRSDEDDAHREVYEEDPARADELHDEGADEAAECKGALGACEHLGGLGVGISGIGVFHVVYELER